MESDSDSCEELNQGVPSSLDFNRMRNAVSATGFREGAGAGREAAFQPGFDKGFLEGFRSGFALGLHNGVVETLRENPSFIPKTAELEGKTIPNARLGLCCLCNHNEDKVHSTKENQTADVSQVISHQREITRKSLEGCQSYLSEVIKTANLSTMAVVLEEAYLEL